MGSSGEHGRVIERYREVTAAIGYHGDTIVNLLGDILSFGVGFMLARHLGFARSVAVFVVTEAVLLCWIRDSLTLNVIMLIYPIDDNLARSDPGPDALASA